MQFMFGNTSLASSLDLDLVHSTTAMIVDEFLKVVMYLDKKITRTIHCDCLDPTNRLFICMLFI